MKRRGRPRKDRAPEHSAERRILDSACQLFYSQRLRAVTAYLERQAEDWRARIAAKVSPADGRAGILRIVELLEAWAKSPGFRGWPFLNATGERHRAWVHELIRGLVASAVLDSDSAWALTSPVTHPPPKPGALRSEPPKAAELWPLTSGLVSDLELATLAERVGG